MKIIVVRDDKPIDQVTVTGETATIGRKSDCDICIKDPAVSGNHARLQKMGDDYLIQDLNSTNGLHYKGRRIRQQMLKNEDVIVIGEHRLKFLIGDGSAPAREVMKMYKREVAHCYLKVLTGEHKGQKILLDDGLTTIGEPGVQVAAVSSRPQGHFIIHVDGGKDRERVPLVNGEPIGFKSRKLEHGDRIEVAGVEMQYEVP